MSYLRCKSRSKASSERVLQARLNSSIVDLSSWRSLAAKTNLAFIDRLTSIYLICHKCFICEREAHSSPPKTKRLWVEYPAQRKMTRQIAVCAHNFSSHRNLITSRAWSLLYLPLLT